LLGGGIGLIEKNIDDVNRHGSPPNNGVDSFAKPFDVYRHTLDGFEIFLRASIRQNSKSLFLSVYIELLYTLPKFVQRKF
jgi:hypothetical protein